MTKNKKKDAKQRQYKNEFIVNRAMHNKTFTYTTISNFLVRDERLNATEKGLMLMILSNNENEYILNMKTLQKQAKIGEDAFFKATRHLKELGYINKKRIKGGVRWTINEIPKIVIIDTPTSTEISSSWNNKNDTPISVENTTNWNDKKDIPISVENTVNWNMNNSPISVENTTSENPVLSNTNSQPSAPTSRGKDGDCHLRKTFGDNLDVGDCVTSATPLEASQPTHTPTVVERKEDIENDKLKDNTPKVELNNTTPMVNTKDNTPKNDLQLIIDNSKPIRFPDGGSRPAFSTIYNNNTNWNTIDLSSYSNYDIAYAINMKDKNTPITEIPSKTYSLMTYLVQYSENVPNSGLWNEYQKLKKNK